MEYVVYILYSGVADKIYIGYTSDIIARYKSHNELSKKGWTAKFRPWKVIYCEFFQEKHNAIQREKQLKGAKGRAWIRENIKTEFESVGFISA